MSPSMSPPHSIQWTLDNFITWWYLPYSNMSYVRDHTIHLLNNILQFLWSIFNSTQCESFILFSKWKKNIVKTMPFKWYVAHPYLHGNNWNEGVSNSTCTQWKCEQAATSLQKLGLLRARHSSVFESVHVYNRETEPERFFPFHLPLPHSYLCVCTL